MPTRIHWTEKTPSPSIAAPQPQLGEMETFLSSRLIGQPLAIERMAAAVNKTFAGFGLPGRPRHIFAFFGSSGTGKSLAARLLAEFLCDEPANLVRLDMPEFKDQKALSRLWGWSDEPSTFAGKLSKRPNSVVLLDEIEKSNLTVQDAFLQVFGEGCFNDQRGWRIDASQAFFILTSNLFRLEHLNPADYETQAMAIRQQLSAYFRQEFVNRIDDIVLFQELDAACLEHIAGLEIERLGRQLALLDIRLEAESAALQWLGNQSIDPGGGARSVLRLVGRQVAEPLGEAVMQGRLSAGMRVLVALEPGGMGVEVRQG